MRKIIILALALVSSIYWQGLDNVRAYEVLYSKNGINNLYIYDTISSNESILISGYNANDIESSNDGNLLSFYDTINGGLRIYNKNTLTLISFITGGYWGSFDNSNHFIYNIGGILHKITFNSGLSSILTDNIVSGGTSGKYNFINYSGIEYFTMVNYEFGGGLISYWGFNNINNFPTLGTYYGYQGDGDFSPPGFLINYHNGFFSFNTNSQYSAGGKRSGTSIFFTGGVNTNYYRDFVSNYGSGNTNFFSFSKDTSNNLYFNLMDSTLNGYEFNAILSGSLISSNVGDFRVIRSLIPPIINGTCGTNATTFSTGATRYTGTFCSRGTQSPTTPSFPEQGEVIEWSCIGSNSGTTASCSSYRLQETLSPINASCGTNVGTYNSYDTRYTGTFCSRGTQSPTTPSFPGLGKTTTWICEGLYGGNNISCSASKNDVVTPLNGSCGTRAQVYNTSATRYTGTFCSRGTRNPTTPSFPTSGNSISWSCNGVDGGVNTSCIASKETDANIMGQCGTRRRLYETGATRYTGTFCSRGTANPTSLLFPDIGKTVYWTCEGSFGYLGSVNCRATRESDGTTGGTTFLGIDWSFITKPLDKISQALYNFIHFEAKWLGFNFDFDSLKNLFSLNLKGNSYTVNNSSCANMLNNRITYQHTTWNYNGGIGNNGKGVFTNKTESCNIISGYITYRTINGGGNLLSSDFRVSNSDICSVNTSLYNDGTYWANDTTQIENGFSYLTKTNYNDIISFNETILKNIRVIPFSLVLFGFDLRQFLNDSITGLVEIIINIIIYPINVLNIVYQDFTILFIHNFPNQYCYYGMTISKIAFTPSNLISSDIPYTSSLGIGIFVMIIFTISALTYLFKKFF